jgi:ATP-binding cassette subfamily C (CFTR/MRP) protein 4
VLGTITLVGWLNPWSFIPAALAIVCMLYVRHQYASCFRDLARLESTTRSPLYSHLTSTIHGLKVIRSYHAEQMCSAEFLSHADDVTRVYHSYATANRWAGLRFDWISLSFVAIVTLLAMIGHISGYHPFSSADIALIFSYSLSLVGLFQWTIRFVKDHFLVFLNIIFVCRQSVAVETQMTSVERVLEYCSLDQEPPAKISNNHRSLMDWPTHGQIVFENVSMCHSTDEDAPLAIRHISLTIEAGEKIGIIGRTGAGKSSLIQTIFRMGILIDGKVIIDGIDISTVGLDDIRPKISVIPQDPILFTGTIRSNLDLFDDYSDAQIWFTLEEVYTTCKIN